MSCHDQRVARPPELSGPRVRLVPCAPEHHARLRELHLEPEVRRWWQDPADDFPANMKLSTNYTVVLDGQVIGFAQWYSEDETIIRLPASISSSIRRWTGAGSVSRPCGFCART